MAIVECGMGNRILNRVSNGSRPTSWNNQVRAIDIRAANFPGANRSGAAPAEVIVYLTVWQDQK